MIFVDLERSPFTKADGLPKAIPAQFTRSPTSRPSEYIKYKWGDYFTNIIGTKNAIKKIVGIFLMYLVHLNSKYTR